MTDNPNEIQCPAHPDGCPESELSYAEILEALTGATTKRDKLVGQHFQTIATMLQDAEVAIKNIPGEGPEATEQRADALAANLMYRENPRSIAYALAVVTLAHRDLVRRTEGPAADIERAAAAIQDNPGYL
jgi:hypothetical protein